jgi:hypothetical protein
MFCWVLKLVAAAAEVPIRGEGVEGDAVVPRVCMRILHLVSD